MQQSSVSLLRKLERITEALDATARTAIRNRAFLETANQDAKLRQCFDKTYEANALNIIRQIFINDFVMAVARCWDARGTDRASLPTLNHYLKQPALEVLSNAAARWVPGMSLEASNRALIHAELPKLTKMIDAQNGGENFARLKRVRQFRDIYLAHDLIVDPEDLPRFQDVFGLLDDTTRIVALCNLLVRGLHIDYEERDQIDRKLASAFWHITKIGMANKVVAAPMTDGTA